MASRPTAADEHGPRTGHLPGMPQEDGAAAGQRRGSRAGLGEGVMRTGPPDQIIGMLYFVVIMEHAHICPTCRMRWPCWATCLGEILKRCAKCHER